MKLILIRGLPGSGKSSLAKTEYPGYVLLEPDMYLIDADGVYRYEPSLIEKAREWCLWKTRMILDDDQKVVVTGTFVQIDEIQPYLDLGVPTEVIEAKGQFKNVHGIPDYVIEEMESQWEHFPEGPVSR